MNILSTIIDALNYHGNLSDHNLSDYNLSDYNLSSNVSSLSSEDGEYYDEFVEDIQFQEVLEASLFRYSTHHVYASSSKICCQICFDDKEQQEMFQIEGCSHSYCTICISRHVESKLQNNNVFISCPGENCKNLMEPASLVSVVPSNVMSRWEQDLCESTILPSQKYYCPYKNCSEILINDHEQRFVITESECPSCRRLFCAQCNVPWHQGITCKEFKRSKKYELELNMLQVLAKQKKWKKCPKCEVFVDKTEGCIHITCRCKFEFCYICGLTWKETHFNTCQS